MKRRTLLGTCSAGLFALSGCLSEATDPLDSGSGTSTAPPIPNSSPPMSTGGLEYSTPDSYERVEVGSRDGISEDYLPHDLDIWHGLESEQTVYLRIFDRRAGTTVHQAEYHVPADATLDVALVRPSEYYVQVWGPPIETPVTLLVPCRFFDCNGSGTAIKVYDDGSVRSTGGSTLKNCPSGHYCSDGQSRNETSSSSA